MSLAGGTGGGRHDDIRCSGIRILRALDGRAVRRADSKGTLKKKTVTYYNEGHAARLQVYSTYLTTHWKGGNRNHHLAAMYLMTATEALRRWAMPNLFGLWPTALREWRVLHGLSGQEYAMYAEHSAVYG